MQAYARHDRGQSGSSLMVETLPGREVSELVEGGGNESGLS